jgi:hypothetical protein
MRKVLSHPVYGTNLEKLIEYLALICDYQSRLPSEQNIQTLKEDLHQKVLKAIGYRAYQCDDEEYDLTWPLIEKCLEVAEKYQLGEIKNLLVRVLTKNLESTTLDQVKERLKIAEK